MHNLGSEPLTLDTLGDVIAQTVDKYPDRIAVRSAFENSTITYAELLKQVYSYYSFSLKVPKACKCDTMCGDSKVFPLFFTSIMFDGKQMMWFMMERARAVAERCVSYFKIFTNNYFVRYNNYTSFDLALDK